MFSNIKGQDKAIKLLNSAINNDRVSQAYIFYGPEGVGKFTSSLYFGMALNCLSKVDKRPCGICVSCHKFLEFSHPDFVYVFPTPNVKITDDGELKAQSAAEYLLHVDARKKTPWEKIYFSSSVEIRKESIMMLQKHLESAQREGKYRICIIDDADEMNSSTANSFLKTLEEPPINTILILLTTKLQSLMPTVLSRCQLVFFKPLSYKVIEEILIQKFLIDKIQAKAYSRIANGNVEQAIRLSQDTKHEARNLSAKLVKAALEKDDLNIINSLAVNKDKFKAEFINDVLHFLSIFLNDLALLKTGSSDIVNEDYKELLLSCADNIQRWETKIPDSIVYIDNLHQKIDGKVNIQYILVNLYDHLKLIFPTNQFK